LFAELIAPSTSAVAGLKEITLTMILGENAAFAISGATSVYTGAIFKGGYQSRYYKQ